VCTGCRPGPSAPPADDSCLIWRRTQGFYSRYSRQIATLEVIWKVDDALSPTPTTPARPLRRSDLQRISYIDSELMRQELPASAPSDCHRFAVIPSHTVNDFRAEIAEFNAVHGARIAPPDVIGAELHDIGGHCFMLWTRVPVRAIG